MPFLSSGNTSETRQGRPPQRQHRQQGHSRSGSLSDDGSVDGSSHPLEPPILVYHESARSIVFRDHLRRAVLKNAEEETQKELKQQQQQQHGGDSSDGDSQDFVQSMARGSFNLGHGDAAQQHPKEIVMTTETGVPDHLIGGYHSRINPLPALDFGPDDDFIPLLRIQEGEEQQDPSTWTPAEQEVVELLKTQRCAVKTIKNTDWAPFIHRFCFPLPQTQQARILPEHADIPPDADHTFNSFLTSTTILPPEGRKMRAYGSTSQYTVGVIFALPAFESDQAEQEVVIKTQTWAWPAGYSAKTEFNIDGRGRLINGRQEALVSLATLRQYNLDYLHKEEYMIGQRLVKGLNTIPYNEVYLRVGGGAGQASHRSLDRGVGLPVALFVRTAKFGHLIALLRTRARLMHTWGESNVKGIPLLLLTSEHGVQVITKDLQRELWKIAAQNLNPFQNPTIAHKTTMKNTDEASFQQKVDELLDLDDSIEAILTPEELAHIAGGFGATDESVAHILKRAMKFDRQHSKQTVEEGGEAGPQEQKDTQSHKLQDIVNEGLASALRSGDYHTSRQLLILYSLVASRGETDEDLSGDADDNEGEGNGEEKKAGEAGHQKTDKDSEFEAEKHHLKLQSSLGRDAESMKKDLIAVQKASHRGDGTVASRIPAPPPPPPLDTDRLRSATNSDGLLAVLGAAQVLRAMQDGSAKRRVQEAVDAVEEWVNYGEQSVAFRIASWYDQRAAQGDLKIATETDSKFMAFVSNKAIANRRDFAKQLRDAISTTDFTDIRFLHAIEHMLSRMHSPCLRLELLQYVLGLDNRYSVAHVARSVELAATCLDISSTR